MLFAGESPKTTFIRQEGFNALPLHEPDLDLLFGNIRKGKLKFISDAEIERVIDADLSLYNEVKPDLVLTDGRFTAPISTQIAGLRHVAIVKSHPLSTGHSPTSPSLTGYRYRKGQANAGDLANVPG